MKLIKELGSVIHERRGSLSDLPKIYLVVKPITYLYKLFGLTFDKNMRLICYVSSLSRSNYI